MKKYSISVCILLCAAFANPSYSTLINGGFENGNFTGWSVDIPFVAIPQPPGLGPAGSAEVKNNFKYLDSLLGTITRFPAEGNYLAALGTGSADYEIVPQGSIHITAKQSTYLNKGDKISGWVSFYNGDFDPQDSGRISVENKYGAKIIDLWQEYSGSSTTIPYNSISPWTYWQWVVPRADTYTLALGVTTGGDNVLSSWALFDGIRVTPSSVPEPATIIMLGTGLMALLWLCRNTFNRTIFQQ